VNRKIFGVFEFDMKLSFSGGIYNDHECTPGVGHSALIYGYGTVKLKNGTFVDFWLCKNSWSVDWGDKGFFRMIRGRNMCGLTSYLIYPIV
jgi:C1A family cysteine protease